MEGFSSDAQRRALHDFCAQKGWEVVGSYDAEARSAWMESSARRPAFRQLLDDALGGEYAIVVTHALDRFSRNLRVMLEAFHIFSQTTSLTCPLPRTSTGQAIRSRITRPKLRWSAYTFWKSAQRPRRKIIWRTWPQSGVRCASFAGTGCRRQFSRPFTWASINELSSRFYQNRITDGQCWRWLSGTTLRSARAKPDIQLEMVETGESRRPFPPGCSNFTPPVLVAQDLRALSAQLRAAPRLYGRPIRAKTGRITRF